MEKRPITFLTGNPHKLEELQAIAADSQLTFESRKLDLDEIQSLSLQEVVADKAKRAYEALGVPIIVEDVSAGLQSLNGLPGTFIKFFEQELGRGALYKLSKAENDRITVTCIAAYYNGETMLFGEGIMTGNLVAPRGEQGFGFDSVLVPDNQPDNGRRTVAEMTAEEKNSFSHRAQALRNLIAQLTI